jgi:integrase
VRASQCVVYSRKRGTWHLKWYENGEPRRKQLGSIRELPDRRSAEKAAEPFRRLLSKPLRAIPLVSVLAKRYTEEKMSTRFSTSRGERSWLKVHIIPLWGDCPITDLQAMEVDLWLRSLKLAPKSKVHIRGVISRLWNYAMYCRQVPTQPNPMELVKIKGASKRRRKPRSLTVEEFQRFIVHLDEPFRSIALVCVCFGLRISECLGLKWSDIDWLNSRLTVERGIVRQVEGEVKTEGSAGAMAIDPAMLSVFRSWRQATQFADATDWIFASPVKLGRLPWSYPRVLQVFYSASETAGVGKLGTHTMRHTYRSWLDSVGTSIAVQQKLMRHADIRTTMNIYGDVVTDEMSVAHAKVVGLVLKN